MLPVALTLCVEVHWDHNNANPLISKVTLLENNLIKGYFGHKLHQLPQLIIMDYSEQYFTQDIDIFSGRKFC